MNAITQGNILKALLRFFFPILLGTFFQQLYNTVDAVIVGRFVGKEALAAVGGSSAVFVQLIVGFFMGITNGGGVIISQCFGAKDSSSLEKTVQTSLLMSLAGGLVMTSIGISLARPILSITRCPEAVLDSSARYLMIFFSGLVPMFIYNMCSGILRGIGDSKTPLLILIIGCFSNIILDLAFVILLDMGIAGVASATVLCQVESAIISINVVQKRKDVFNLNLLKMSMDRKILGRIMRLGIPSGLQGSLYVISNLIIQTNINFFGTDSIAGWAIYGKIDVIFWMTTATFGIALTTFSGQNFGAGQYDRIKKATWITLGLSLASTSVIVFAFMNWSQGIYRLFTNDQEVLEKGIEMVRYLAPFYFVYISIEILSGTVRGAGKSLAPTLITVFGVCALRLLWLFIAVPANQTMRMVLFSYPLTWTVTSLAFWVYFLSNRWLKK
ncbi:MATE family efflux transporter [Treponema sp.]|uniref:MATE family efflux transporter n=1 Tax=Treponema sp. TaxID=166 RepID=UPI00388E75AF